MSAVMLSPMEATWETAAYREWLVRERIVATAYDLFARRGVRDVGIADAGVLVRLGRWQAA